MTSPALGPALQFCVPANPTIRRLREHATLGLRKLRAGRNISGILREIPAYAAPTDATTGMPTIQNGQLAVPGARAVPPTAYRYAVLIARAKELAQQAAQFEGLYTAAIEKRDEARYTRDKARQELSLATAQVRLQGLRVIEANAGVALADLQVQRAQVQQRTYEAWIANGRNTYERNLLDLYERQATWQGELAIKSALAQTAIAATTAATAGVGAAAAAASAAVVGVMAGGMAASSVKLADIQRDIQTNTLLANYERQIDQFRLQAVLAAQDQLIGLQSRLIAADHVSVVEQEQTIAGLAESQSRDRLEFLANRFTSFELYDAMTSVLADAYRSLLQKAAATLNVARSQIAFQRQEEPPVAIQSDYWSTANQGLSQTPTTDLRGLTGSARLLADLYQLDQWAFDTDRRKIPVTKTISLAQLAPVEFARLRETGVMVFSTPTELFDRDFPGHYLRLIRRVRTSVIALIPPGEGIKATLSNTGISRVVVGPDPFQTVTLRREPQTVALSNPIDSTGTLEPDAADGMYFPFENNGLDTMWEFRMPQAANRIDYATLMDVVVSFDYLAFHSFDYQQTVIRQLKPQISTDLRFSLKNDFSDAWFDLTNPDLLNEPDRFVVTVDVDPSNNPPNLLNARLTNLSMRFCGRGAVDFGVAGLRRIDRDGIATSAGAGVARTIERQLSAKAGSGALWQPLVGASAAGRPPTPFGTWTIDLRSANPVQEHELRDALATGSLTDILFVLSYEAETPPWPA